jgi:GntR family transcriptional regulator, transcriptional repressor for pyruvate dehydrogenase complex
MTRTVREPDTQLSGLEVESPVAGSGESGRRGDHIVGALKHYLLTNRFPPGTRLPPERQLAEALMVSRNALREALQSLATLGIVEQRHGSGVYVCDFDPDRLAEQLSYGLREDARYWRHLLDARTQVEQMVARLAAQRITAVQLDHLHGLLERMRRQMGQEHSLTRIDRTFHLDLAACVANPVLERLARSVISEYFRYAVTLRLTQSLVGNPVTVHNHEPMLAALKARDPEASEAAMRYHFRDLARHVDEVLHALPA